jgi:heterodisulfide reductase subunit A-like polyferredoxin
VADTDRIKNYLNTHNVQKAVVVGAGFIGLEMAENLCHAGADVSIVEMESGDGSCRFFNCRTSPSTFIAKRSKSLFGTNG